MLWRILIDGAQMGWVEPGTGFVWDNDGDRVHRGVGYETVDTDPTQPAWYTPTVINLPPAVVARIRRVLKRAFRDRFTDQEKQAMELAAVDNIASATAVRNRQARLRAFLQDIQAADYVDLDRPTIRAAVLALEANNVISAGRAAQILDVDGTPDEIADD